MNFRWFAGAARCAFSFAKPQAAKTVRQQNFAKSLLHRYCYPPYSQTTTLLSRTTLCSSNNLMLVNLRELLEKKSKLTEELQGLVSMVLGYNVEEGTRLIGWSASGVSVDCLSNSGRLQGLTVKMNAGTPIVKAADM